MIILILYSSLWSLKLEEHAVRPFKVSIEKWGIVLCWACLCMWLSHPAIFPAAPLRYLSHWLYFSLQFYSSLAFLLKFYLYLISFPYTELFSLFPSTICVFTVFIPGLTHPLFEFLEGTYDFCFENNRFCVSIKPFFSSNVTVESLIFGKDLPAWLFTPGLQDTPWSQWCAG